MSEKKRGRPRGYDPGQALAAAMGQFWGAGYSATSLDQLAAATGMNRPSLYGAFGSKEDLYLKALEAYRDAGAAAMEAALDPALDFPQGLLRVYSAALDVYMEQDGRGCFLVGTAVAEARDNPAVRAMLADSLARFDGVIEARVRMAMETGELARSVDPDLLSRLAQGQMLALAVRARAGDSRAALDRLAVAAVEMVCRAAS